MFPCVANRMKRLASRVIQNAQHSAKLQQLNLEFVRRSYTSDMLTEHARIKMPKIDSESDNVGQILKWHKSVGDHITVKDTLCDIQIGDLIIGVSPETDGFLVEMSVPEGARVKAGTTVARQVLNESEMEIFLQSKVINIKKAKKDIVLAHRILSKINYANDIMSDHLSVSVPSRITAGNRTMITSAFGSDWSTITFDDLMEIEVETRRFPNSSMNNMQHTLKNIDPTLQPQSANVAQNHNEPFNSTIQSKEVDLVTSELHRSLLAADPNIHAIFHVHTPAMLKFSCLNGEFGKLLMLHPNSCKFYNKLMYFDGSTNLKGDTDHDIALQFLKNDDANIIIVKNEGIIITARSVAMAFDQFYYLNQSINLQMGLLTANSKVTFDEINDSEMKRLSQEYNKNAEYFANSHFDARAKYILNKDETLRQQFNDL